MYIGTDNAEPEPRSALELLLLPPEVLFLSLNIPSNDTNDVIFL